MQAAGNHRIRLVTCWRGGSGLPEPQSALKHICIHTGCLKKRSIIQDGQTQMAQDGQTQIALRLMSLTSLKVDGNLQDDAGSDGCNTLQARLASGEDIFGPLIQKYLLKNSHRIRVDTLPDDELAARQEADEKARLGDIRRQMDSTQEEGVIAETVELQRRQVSDFLARGPPIVNRSCDCCTRL